MAGDSGSQTDRIDKLSGLLDQPLKDLFPVLRWLECADPKSDRFGRSSTPRKEIVKICQQPDVVFAASTVSSVERSTVLGKWVVRQFAFGLFGPNGPLPLHLTDLARARFQTAHDPTLTAFADVFHHRLASLFYRAWADAEPTVQRDRPNSDRFARYVASLCGIGVKELENRDAVTDAQKLYFVATLGSQAKQPDGLAAFLSHLFDAKVNVIEFVPRWFELDPRDHTKLGNRQSPPLALGSVLGGRIWEAQFSFQVRIVADNKRQFSFLLPGAPGLERLVAAVRNFIGDELYWRLNLVLAKQAAERLQLGRGHKLGLSTWLLSRPPDRDLDDLHINVERHVYGGQKHSEAKRNRQAYTPIPSTTS